MAASTHSERITVAVEFYADVPDDDAAADAHADTVADAIAAAVNAIGAHGIYPESASVADFTSERDDLV